MTTPTPTHIRPGVWQALIEPLPGIQIGHLVPPKGVVVSFVHDTKGGNFRTRAKIIGPKVDVLAAVERIEELRA